MRCRICPAVADEDHCAKCHAVHDRLQDDYLDDMTQPTEVVNQ